MPSSNPNHYCVVVSQAPQSANDKAALLKDAKWEQDEVIRVKFVAGDDALRDRVRSVAEEWVAYDSLALTQELGVVPEPPTA